MKNIHVIILGFGLVLAGLLYSIPGAAAAENTKAECCKQKEACCATQQAGCCKAGEQAKAEGCCAVKKECCTATEKPGCCKADKADAAKKQASANADGNCCFPGSPCCTPGSACCGNKAAA